MKEKELKEKLYNKLSKEFEKYIKELKDCEIEVVVNSAYEVVMKEEFLSLFEPSFNNFDMKTNKYFYKNADTLNELYNEWLDSEFNINPTLNDFVNLSFKELIETNEIKMKKQKDKER